MASKEHDDLCKRAVKFLNNNGFKVAFDDTFCGVTQTNEQPDAIGFRNGVSCLVEVKVSRSDFLADKKKHFRVNPETGMGDWRFFLCPKDLIKPEEIPEGWGLLYWTGKVIRKVKGFPANTQWHKKPFNSNKQAECDFMYSALRRVQIYGHLDDVYRKMEKVLHNEGKVLRIEPEEIKRDKDGYWTHSMFPDLPDNSSWRDWNKWASENNLKLFVVWKETDVSDDISFESWQPTPPSKDAFLFCMHTCNDGEFAWFAVPHKR